MILAGDVGGTKTYLAQFDPRDGDVGPPLAAEHVRNDRYPSLEALIEDYGSRHPFRARAACFGVAGPVVKDRVHVTHLGWDIEAAQLAQKLKLPRVHLINDLVANGYGIAALKPTEVETLQAGELDEEGNAALVAAGTGLGESILVRVRGDLIPIPSEAGHADFAPRTDDELRVFTAFRARHGRVSYERVLSGPGLCAVAQLFHEERGESAMWSRHVEEGGEEGPAWVVSRLGMEKACRPCEDALRLFVGAYGAEAGNMALRALARGGIYLGGGIAPKILPALRWDVFLEAFRDKEHLRPLLVTIPVWVIRNECTALLGAARYAAITEG